MIKKTYDTYMNEKIHGYIFLISGVIIMLFAVVYLILTFTNKIQPLPIFSLAATQQQIAVSPTDANSSIKNSKQGKTQNIPLDINSLTASLQGGTPGVALPKVEIIPPQLLDQALNMSITFFLMTFLMGFGYKLASIGVLFLRPIVVKLKTSDGEILNNKYGPLQ